MSADSRLVSPASQTPAHSGRLSGRPNVLLTIREKTKITSSRGAPRFSISAPRRIHRPYFFLDGVDFGDTHRGSIKGRSPHCCRERAFDVTLTSRRFCCLSVVVQCSQGGYKKIASEWQVAGAGAGITPASNAFVCEKGGRESERSNARALSLFFFFFFNLP